MPYFLALLEHLNILVPAEIFGIKKFDYFLPCALAHAPESCERVSDRTVEYALLLSFLCSPSEDIFVPTGFFSNLIGFLQKENWSVITEPDKDGIDRPCQYRNQIYFSARVKGIPFNMTVKLRFNFVEFMIMEIDGNDSTSSPHCNRQNVCQYVRNLLQKNVHGICVKLQCTKLEMKFGLYCSRPDCKPSRFRHYQILNLFFSKEHPHFACHVHVSELGLGMQCLKTNIQYNLKDDEVARFWFKQQGNTFIINFSQYNTCLIYTCNLYSIVIHMIYSSSDILQNYQLVFLTEIPIIIIFMSYMYCVIIIIIIIHDCVDYYYYSFV